MPFSSDFDALYENAIQPAISAISGFTCLRADELYGPRPIMADIWRSINDAHILVADLTGRNPNVLYELGLAHAKHKPVVMITQSMEDVPFDLKAIRCLVYSNSRTGRGFLADHLTETLRQLANDLRRGRKDSLQEYIVLSPAQRQKPSKSQVVALSVDSTDEPWKVVTALRQHSETLKSQRGKKKLVPPEDIQLALSLLESESVEIKLAALEFLQAHIDRTNTPLLYPFLDDGDSAVRKAVVNSIHRDTSSERFLLDRLREAIPDDLRRTIVAALSSRAQDETIDLCRDLAVSAQDGQVRRDMFRVVRGNYGEFSREPLLSLGLEDGFFESLAVADRVSLVEAISHLESYDLRIHDHVKPAAQKILQLARADPHPKVLGSAASAWLNLGKREFGPLVRRDEAWEIVAGRGREAIEAFIDNVTGDAEVLVPEDGVRLVALVDGDPVLEGEVVWQLQHLRAPGVEDFVLRFAEPSEKGSLWAFAYFAQCPSKKAVEACERILTEATADLSERVLAAICLAKLGDGTRIDFIVQSAGDAHGWVGALARPLLEPLAAKRSKRGKQARALLEVLPNS